MDEFYKPIDDKGCYVYDCDSISNYDGDSFTLTIYLKMDCGFGVKNIWSKEIKTRIKGVDTPELRSKNPKHKALAKIAKQMASDWVRENDGVVFVSMDKPDKYGRALGDFENSFGERLSEFLIKNKLGVAYKGQNKLQVQAGHEANIKAWDKKIKEIKLSGI